MKILVMGLARINKQVCDKHNSAYWIITTDSGFEVNHIDGVLDQDEYHPDIHNDNNNFLNL